MATLLFPVVSQCRIYLWTLSLSLAWSKTVYRASITVTLTSDLFGCMSLWLRLCALDDDLLLLPVLSVILKMYKYRSLYSCLVISYHFKSITFKNVTSVKFISLLHRHTVLVVGKQVTWTLDPNRPRKTGSIYNDILNCVRKPKRSVTTHSVIVYYAIFGRNRTGGGGGHFIPSVAGIRVNSRWF